jgi:glycosyltransferase involved in cell wall biosynthesis
MGKTLDIMKENTISITFVIFTYNSSDLIQKTLDHLITAIKYYPIDHEVIVVDNNSSDETLDIIKKFCDVNKINITIVENKRQGLSYSRIEGVKRVNKEYITFIDDDNFLSQNWIEVVEKIVNENNPDVIGCRTIGITDGEFPKWWNTYQGAYACGTRFEYTGFISNPLQKIWGAGLTARTKYVKPALLDADLYCTGRIGNKQMSGEDTELNYRMRMLGASFYNSNDLYLEHFMRGKRLTLSHLRRTREGNAISSVNLDIYKYLLTKKKRYKLINMAILVLIFSLPLSIKYRINYFKYAIMRFKTLSNRSIMQKRIKQVFLKKKGNLR